MGTVWIGTKSQQIFALNISTFALQRSTLPDLPSILSSPYIKTWSTQELYAPSNNSPFIVAASITSGGITSDFAWSLATGTVSNLAMLDALRRSGDGSRVFGLLSDGTSCKRQRAVASGNISTYMVDPGFTEAPHVVRFKQ